MLWEAAVGEKMWQGLSDVTVMNRVVNEQVPRPRERNPRVDARLEQLIMKALAPDPNHRHQTAKELQEDVDRVRHELGFSAGTRDIGPMLDQLFSEDRLSTDGVIQERLLERTGVTGSSAHSPDLSSSIKEYAYDAKGRRARGTLLGVLGLLVGLGALLAFAQSRGFGAERATTHSSAPLVTTHPVRITAFPRTATIRLDGAPSSTNPLVVTLPANGERHLLQISAPGYYEREERLVVDGEVDSTVRLIPLPAAAPTLAPAPDVPEAAPPAAEVRPREHAATSAPSNSAQPRRASAPPSALAVRVPPEPQCDPPDVVDARGIKRFKLACMP
jgi:serine/threonine-protein kinase